MAKIFKGKEQKALIPNVSAGSVLFDRIVANNRNSVALICGVTGQKISYAQLLDQSKRLAGGLRECGIKEGETVAIISGNTLEYYPVVLATLFLGATVAPINPTFVEGELEHCLSISVPRLVVCSPLVVSRVDPVVRHMVTNRTLPSGARCVVTGSTDMSGVASTHQLTSKVTNTEGLPVFVHQAAHKTSFVMCSSGTTGLPKGVELTNRGVITYILYCDDTSVMNLTPKDTILGLLPYFHAFGLSIGMTAFSHGSSLVVMPKFQPELFLTALQNYKISVAYLVPPLMLFLGKHPLVPTFDLSNLRDIVCGAAPLSKELQQLVTKRLGKDIVRQVYGLTETTFAATITPIKQYYDKYGSIGKLVPGIKCKVVDQETGHILGPNQPGELCFHGAIVMKGYKDNPQATEGTIDNAGWLHTGDLGYFDHDHFIYIVDRVKEIIKYKGFQVAPAELEALLLTHPDIHDSAVIGVPDERSGELPLAFVELRPGAELSEKQVYDFVASKISPIKHLRGGVKFVSTIPKSASGKILRKNLREQMKNINNINII